MKTTVVAITVELEDAGSIRLEFRGDLPALSEADREVVLTFIHWMLGERTES